jgi:uncharacterized protein (DUF2236 family)
MDGNPAEIDAADLERSLDLVRSNAAGSAEGVFGPGSAMWQVDREAILFLGAGRALLLQLAHPWVATAIAEHSSALADPIGRFHRTFDIVFTLVFGSLDQALAASRRLHRRHAEISGRMPESLGAYPQGSPYLANELSALMWVHATLVDTAIGVHDLVLPPLGSEARERYYADCRLLGLLFGIPLESQPADWAAFAAYVEATLASDRLDVGPVARELGTRVLAGAGRLPVPRWYRDVTAALMPEPLRAAFDLPFGEGERRRAGRALCMIRRSHPALPARLRHVGPYQEAMGRLSGRSRPDLLTRSVNRLWIGRSSMG